MTVEPSWTWSVRNACSESVDASANIAMRQRPNPFGSLRSTAMATRDFLPLPRPAHEDPVSGDGPHGVVLDRRRLPGLGWRGVAAGVAGECDRGDRHRPG